MSYDPKCAELARYFLTDTDMPVPTMDQLNRLAQGIQDYMEDFLSDLEHERLQELEAAKDEADDRRGKERDEWRHEAAEAKRLK